MKKIIFVAGLLAPDIYAGRFIDPRTIEHDYLLEDDVSAALTYLLSLPDVSTSRACLYSQTRGGYYTLKVAVTKGLQGRRPASRTFHPQKPEAVCRTGKSM